MISAHASPPTMERPPLDAGVLRSGVLALIAQIVGSMFMYDLVRTSPQTPLPRPWPNVLGAAPSLAANPSAIHRRHSIQSSSSCGPLGLSLKHGEKARD
jgi:hypothetical protein